jgi:hypothetical protein
VYEPIFKACLVTRQSSIAEVWREPPATPSMISARFPFPIGSGGKGKEDLVLAGGSVPSGLPRGDGELLGGFSFRRVWLTMVWRKQVDSIGLDNFGAVFQYPELRFGWAPIPICLKIERIWASVEQTLELGVIPRGGEGGLWPGWPLGWWRLWCCWIAVEVVLGGQGRLLRRMPLGRSQAQWERW